MLVFCRAAWCYWCWLCYWCWASCSSSSMLGENSPAFLEPAYSCLSLVITRSGGLPIGHSAGQQSSYWSLSYRPTAAFHWSLPGQAVFLLVTLRSAVFLLVTVIGLQLPFIGHYQVRRSSYWSLAGQQPSYWSLAIQEAFLLVIVIVKQPSYESQAGQQPFY